MYIQHSEANELVLKCWRVSQLPALEKKTVGKMGLAGISGLNVSSGGGGGG